MFPGRNYLAHDARPATPTAPVAAFVFCSLLSLLLCGLETRAEVIHINATAPADSNSTLEHYLCTAAGRGSLQAGTTLSLSAGTHTLGLGEFCLLQDLEELTIQGAGALDDPTVVHCTSNNSGRGLAFINMTSLRLQGLYITNCGMEVPSGLPGFVNDTFLYLGPQQKAVLVFSHCTNMAVERVSIVRCYGFGMLVVNPLGSTVIDALTASDTDYTNTFLCTNTTTDLSCSGSGAVFIFGDTNITNSLLHSHPDGFYNKTSLVLTNSVFCNNKNKLPNIEFFRLYSQLRRGYRTQRLLLVGASGLAVTVGQTNFSADISISNCNISHNVGDLGGAIIGYFNSLRNTKVNINSTVVENNTAVLIGRGGGILVTVVTFFDFLNTFPDYPDDAFDLLKIENSRIQHNQAGNGGGMYFHLLTQNISSIRIIIRNTVFFRNVAVYGSAVNAFRTSSTLAPKSIHFLLEDVRANENTYSGIVRDIASPENTGVFLFMQIHNITVYGTRLKSKGCLFQDNTVSAFLLSASNIALSGNIAFRNNQGFHGGALNVFDNGLLLIWEGSHIVFENNTAVHRGGAIFIDTLSSGGTTACVIQFFGPRRVELDSNTKVRLNLSVTFTKNRASVAGNSVYGNPLYKCLFLPESAIERSDSFLYDIGQETLLYANHFEFTANVSNRIAEMSSDASRICLCENSTFVSNSCNGFQESTIRDVIPGDDFKLYVNPVDLSLTPVSSILYAFVTLNSSNSSNSSLPIIGGGRDVQIAQGFISECSLATFRIFAAEDSVVYLYLSATTGGMRSRVTVKMTHCPPGFDITDVDGRQHCACSDFINNHIRSSCNITTFKVLRRLSTWIGSINDSGILQVNFAKSCPIHFCKGQLTELDLRVPDYICSPGRTGVLCGACKGDLSVVFGAGECKYCSNYWLATIVMYAALGPLLVFFLFLLDFTVTRGTINGLIFYANIVGVNANILFSGSRNRFLLVFVSLLNLELGFPLCFYNGMTQVAKSGLQYVFPFYILLIVACIIFLSHYTKLMQKIVARYAGFQVLCTLFYLSYSKIVRTAIDTFTFLPVFNENGSSMIWFFDGNLNYTSPTLISLVVLGVLVFICFVLPYVIILTFPSYIQKYVRSIRLKIFIDANLAPFKPNRRYWFGVRLVLILLLYLAYAFAGTNSPKRVAALQATLISIFAVAQALLRPFQKLSIELLDLLFTVRIVVLLLWTITYRGIEYNLSLLDNISMGLTFVLFCCIIIYHIIQLPFLKKQFSKCLKKRLAKKNRHSLTGEPPRPSPTTGENTNASDTNSVEMSEEAVERPCANQTNQQQRPTFSRLTFRFTQPMMIHQTDFSQLREPILASPRNV